jgi:hypothetical protein
VVSTKCGTGGDRNMCRGKEMSHHCQPAPFLKSKNPQLSVIERLIKKQRGWKDQHRLVSPQLLEGSLARSWSICLQIGVDNVQLLVPIEVHFSHGQVPTGNTHQDL